MKIIIKYMLLSLLLYTVVFSSCNQAPKKIEHNRSQIDSISVNQKCIVDSLTVDFLQKASYKKAIETCNLTILDREFSLNEIVAFGVRANLGNIFTKEELASNMKLKEVKWESKDTDYIIVWYKKSGNTWKPIDLLKYGKGVRF